MFEQPEASSQSSESRLAMAEVSQGVPGSKDGRGIGDLVDRKTIEEWANQYLAENNSRDESQLGVASAVAAFQFGVQAESRLAGQSFIEAEPQIRSEWSSERNRLPWECVRDAVWAGFDRARTLTV
jgi:hypothetical protein